MRVRYRRAGTILLCVNLAVAVWWLVGCGGDAKPVRREPRGVERERRGVKAVANGNEWVLEVEAMPGVARDKSYKRYPGWARFRHSQYSGRAAGIVRERGAKLEAACDLPAGRYNVVARVHDEGTGRANSITIGIADQSKTLEWRGDERRMRDVSTEMEITKPAVAVRLEATKRGQKYLVVDKLTLRRQ